MLDDAYRATTYRVFVPDAAPIDLKVGERSAALDGILMAQGVAAWAFITGSNPRSQPLSAEENGRRHAELMRSIRDGGWRYFDGAGIPANAEWQPEASVLVLGIARDEALALGRRFEQNAIVAGRRGGEAELVYCT